MRSLDFPAEELAVPVPGLRAVRWTTDELHSGIKEYYAVGRTERGQSEFWSRGRVWRGSPGSIQVKEAGDVHRDVARDGPTTFVVVTLPVADVQRVREEGRHLAHPHLERDDERARPFHRLLDAVCSGADRLSVEVALAEAVSAFATISKRTPDHTRPVRRAIEYLHARTAESITLEELASHADLDKFHLCRAFRAQVGMPPHAYLVNLRVLRAKELLARGMRASEVAPIVGLYDQSQQTRHFRRIVGVTPGRFGKLRGSASFREGTPSGR